MEDNKNQDCKTKTDGKSKKKYEKPRIISYEPIEAVAGACKQFPDIFTCPPPPVPNS